MKQFRLLLKTVVFAALALSMSLQANITPLAFNGIFKCFKPGYEMYAPNLGCAALQTGLVHALRFYTTIPGGNDAQGRRLWINDAAYADDPVAALTLLLFPSPAGNLTAMTSHPENIGRDLTVHHVAQLLNFCAHIRAAVPQMGGNRFGNDATKCLKRLQAAAYKESENKNINDNYFSRFFEFQHAPKDFKYKLRSLLFSDQGRKLIVALCKIIEHEERITEKIEYEEQTAEMIEHEERTTQMKFYPKYQAEQLLNAFFCLKFGKNDIPELLENLDDSIVDHEQFLEARLIDSSDIKPVKPDEIKDMTLDDLWVIQNRDLIDQVIPYPRGCKPVNNGNASGYNRDQDELIIDKTFPDCTETTIRHLCNLVLFSKEGSFKLENALQQLKNSPIKNLSVNLQAFYRLQSPDKANSGERSVRDAWCKVVGDLGQPVRYRRKSVRTNVDNDTEVDSGIINIIRVLNIIFNLELDPEPVYDPKASNPDQKFQTDVGIWAKNGLQKLFEIISPEKEVDIEISEVSAFRAFGNYEYDCIGKIQASVNQDFKFTMSVGSGHAQFDTIDILVPEQAPINEDILKQVIIKFQNAFSEKTTESIFLLNNKTKNLVTTPAYSFFKNGVHDSAQIIDTLELLLKMTQNNEISLTFSGRILKNLLHNFLWQDQAMSEKIQPILGDWTDYALKSNNLNMKSILQEEVKSVQYDLLCKYFDNSIEYDLFCINFDNNAKADDLLDFFHQAHTIFCSVGSNISSFSFLRKHKSIKKINLTMSYIIEKKLEISGNIFPNLETFSLSYTKTLKSIKLSGSLQNLKTINLDHSSITELEISGDACPNLETLNLRNTEKLKSIKLSGIFQKLKSIDLHFSAITELELSGNMFPNLENLDLSNTGKLKSIKLSGIFQKLKSIDLRFSAITELELSGNMLPNLENLDLGYTDKLKSLKLLEIFQNLRTIDIAKSAIIEIIIRPGICPNLQITDQRIKIIELKRNSPDGERDDEPNAKKQCLNDIRES